MLLLILDYRGETKTMPCDLTRKEIREIVTFWICSTHMPKFPRLITPDLGHQICRKMVPKVLPYVRFHIMRG